MGVQKPTRHTRRMRAVPARVEKVHLDVRDVLNRRAEIARAARIAPFQRLPEFGINEGDSGYLGYDVSGPGMPTIRVAREQMIHSHSRQAEPVSEKKRGRRAK